MAEDEILREVTLTLPNAANMEMAATKTATAMAEYMDMAADKVDEIRMAVVEACINAFEHSGSEDGKVYLTFTVLGAVEPTMLRITVRDTGHGFEPDEVSTPNIAQKITAENKRGWGLQIMRGLMDDVQIHSGDDGTRVVMTKAK
jgi:serine/threonine-protein kinase RsbW